MAEVYFLLLLLARLRRPFLLAVRHSLQAASALTSSVGWLLAIGLIEVSAARMYVYCYAVKSYSINTPSKICITRAILKLLAVRKSGAY